MIKLLILNTIYFLLFSNELTGIIPSEIGNLTNLTGLWLYSNQLTSTIPPEIAGELGRMLATIHGVKLPRSGDRVLPSLVGAEAWDEIVDRARTLDAPWADLYVSRSSEIFNLESRVRVMAKHPTVPGHRDADDKNTLLGEEGELILLDWDAAGAVDAGEEPTSVLLDWSGAPRGKARPEVVRAIRDTYFERAERDAPDAA